MAHGLRIFATLSLHVAGSNFHHSIFALWIQLAARNALRVQLRGKVPS